LVARANLSPFERPDRVSRSMLTALAWGTSLPGVVAASAVRQPNRIAIEDESGAVTYRALWDRARRVATGLIDGGVGPGTGIGLLCRNHIGFVEWLIAAVATGADVVLLNTGFAGPQLADVVAHEGIRFVIHDNEFTDVVATCGVTTFDESAMATLATTPHKTAPRRSLGRMVILTSGTTGRPKGAGRRSDPGAVEGVAALVERVPYRFGDTQVIAAPLFHGWGLTNLLLGLGRCSTTVVARRFEPEATLRSVSSTKANVFVVVPVMLNRILALAPDVLLDAATPKLRVIASSGSALGPKLASDVLNRFGPVLYNIYGSTEVAVATIASPGDLRNAPSTAGKPAFGVRVEVLDAQGEPVPDGSVGRIFVGGAMKFDGYTDGATKERQHGLISTGDLGSFRNGLLFVDGREDDMIVSGGENVFPAEVEDLLAHHRNIAEVAVVGVPDEQFGQALAAFVVVRAGAALDEDAVKAHVRTQLARHKVPRHVEFMDMLPRNPTGKVLRRVLVDRYAATTVSST
jgi:fatty-acyl-CoA synthase